VVVIKAEKKNEKYYNRKIKLATKNVHAEKRGEKMQKKNVKKYIITEGSAIRLEKEIFVYNMK